MLDYRHMTKIMKEHFETVTPEEFRENLAKSLAELFEFRRHAANIFFTRVAVKLKILRLNFYPFIFGGNGQVRETQNKQSENCRRKQLA